MSLGLHHRHVNVSRTQLIAKLKENLVAHSTDFAEAVIGYKIKLLTNLQTAIDSVTKANPVDLKDARPVTFAFPQNHEQEYQEVIDMMEASVDETIQLDSESFKAYWKNEWAWSKGVSALNNVYKSFGGSVGAAGAV